MTIKIAHIADVHFRALARHDEYKQVFEAFAADMIANGVNHVFVGGDIFHTKTTGLSPEYIDLMSWWLDLLARAVEPLDGAVHLTLGNHDGNLVNSTRQDAVSPIVRAVGNPRVKLYKKSGVYQFAPGYNWCVFSLFDTDGWKNVRPIAGDVNIACYHGPVSGARTESNWIIEDEVTIDFFRSYDYCFLGDIHATQFLEFRDQEIIIDTADLIHYPGADVIEELP